MQKNVSAYPLDFVYSFPREKRLFESSDYRRVFQKSKKLVNRHLVLYIRFNLKEENPRLGLAIAKKQIPKAVQRNRIKRLIRESFRQQTVLHHVEIIAVARKSLNNANNLELRESLESLWKQLTVYLEEL